MKENQSSATALGATMIRAVHQLIDETPHILEDPISPLLIGEEAIRTIREGPEETGHVTHEGFAPTSSCAAGTPRMNWPSRELSSM